ncbi:hypothetical protein HXX01_03930 [Candidatus Nomurabacteria bacterium]|nr:hypothetical protein [Candidatus Nomurabacteria bacterium]
MKYLSKIILNTNFSIITIIILFSLIFVNKVEALTISPARIEIIGDKGTTITKEITLFNDSKDKSETYYISYANFESQGESGSPRFVEPKNDLGTWMNAGDKVVIEAGKSKTIPLVINIPKEADSGGHFAVVFFGNNPNSKDGSQVSIGAKTGTLVLLSVKGDVLEAGGLVDFKTKDNKFFYNSLPVSFLYRWKNDGNDRVKPEGDINIHSILYWPTIKIDANSVSGNILPHSTRLFNIDWIKYQPEIKAKKNNSFVNSYFDTVHYQWQNFALGPYLAKLDLVYGASGNHSSKYVFFFIFPWQLLIVLIILFTVIFFVGRDLIKRYNRYIIKKAHETMHISNEAKHD